MAHFAQLNEVDVVVNVIVINNHEMINTEGVEDEQIGVQICKNICGQDTRWVQTSYNSNFRGIYAQIGGTYDAEADVFVPVPDDFEWN